MKHKLIKWFWKHTKWKTSMCAKKNLNRCTPKKWTRHFTTKCRTKVYNIGTVEKEGCLPTLRGGGEDMGWWYMYMYEFKQPYFTLHWQFKRFTILFWAPFSPHFFSKKVKNYYLPPPSYFVTKTTVQIPLIKWSTKRHMYTCSPVQR